MIGMREQIARSHFEMERALEMQQIKNLVVNDAPKTKRAMYLAVEKATWENIPQARRERYLSMADIALICLLKPTDAMIHAAYDEFSGASPKVRTEEDVHFITAINRGLIQAAKDGK